ncbi:MAG: hypothetical protein AAF658_03315 [Myxococcota bacterium]
MITLPSSRELAPLIPALPAAAFVGAKVNQVLHHLPMPMGCGIGMGDPAALTQYMWNTPVPGIIAEAVITAVPALTIASGVYLAVDMGLNAIQNLRAGAQSSAG